MQVTIEKATFSGESWMLGCVTATRRPVVVNLPGGSPLPSMNSTTRISWPAERSLLLKPEPEPSSPGPA